MFVLSGTIGHLNKEINHETRRIFRESNRQRRKSTAIRKSKHNGLRTAPKEVGGGSPARLKQVWDEYEASSTQTVPVISKTSNLPPEVADSINEFCASITKQINSVATELNEKAINAAERKVHEVVKNGIEQRAQDQKEIDDASKTVEDLDSKLDESKTEIEALKSELAKANELNQNLTLKHAQTLTELETVKASLSDLIAKASIDFNKSKVLIETSQKQEIEIAKLRERMLIVMNQPKLQKMN